jgi:hypothetical protein
MIVGLHSHAMRKEILGMPIHVGGRRDQTRQSKGVRGKCGDVGGAVAEVRLAKRQF